MKIQKPLFIMLCGLPGSGKSTLAQKLANQYNAQICSSDELRKELLGDIQDQKHNELIFSTLHARIKDGLKEGKNIIFDATNLSRKKRMFFLNYIDNIPCEKICYLVATPYEICFERNETRERQVPNGVITKMLKSFEIPYYYEGWNKIEIYFGENDTFKGYYGKAYPNFIQKYSDFSQDNSHHELSLGRHCQVCALSLHSDRGVDVFCAAYVHDCGKPETKTFTNTKGEVTEEAHYYNHQFVSAYKSLFFDWDCVDTFTLLHIAIIVMWHMQPYFWEKDNNEKSRVKYQKLWGEKLYKEIMQVHEADKNAR